MFTRAKPGARGRDRTFGSDAGFHPIAQANSSDLKSAVSACDFPLVVWLSPAATITMANEAAADLLGVGLEDLVGRSAFQFRLPPKAVHRAVAAITSDEVDILRSKDRFTRQDGQTIPIWLWTRAIELDGERGGVTLITRSSDVPRLGCDTLAPWRELVPIAIGVINQTWRIEAVSTDIRVITGQTPAQIRGRLLLDLVHPDDRSRLTGPGAGPPPTHATSRCHLRLQGRAGWTDACILLAPSDAGQLLSFGVVGSPALAAPTADRVAELELRLRRIAAEVRAAGVLEGMGDMPSPDNVPELRELSSRQWEIVSRLLHGQRVGTIAEALFVSPSTVRNHLTTIFRKFGVHSQSELLELLWGRREQVAEH